MKDLKRHFDSKCLIGPLGFVAGVVILISYMAATYVYAGSEVKKITAEHLNRLISRNKKVVVVNVLPAKHYKRKHIKGSINIPREELKERASQMLRKRQKIVVYCASTMCPESKYAAKILSKLGYKNVLEYPGGIKEWVKLRVDWLEDNTDAEFEDGPFQIGGSKAEKIHLKVTGK